MPTASCAGRVDAVVWDRDGRTGRYICEQPRRTRDRRRDMTMDGYRSESPESLFLLANSACSIRSNLLSCNGSPELALFVAHKIALKYAERIAAFCSARALMVAAPV